MTLFNEAIAEIYHLLFYFIVFHMLCTRSWHPHAVLCSCFQDILTPPKCTVPLLRSGSSVATFCVNIPLTSFLGTLYIKSKMMKLTQKVFAVIYQFSLVKTALSMVVVTLPLAIPWGEWGEGSSCLSHNRYILIRNKDNRSHDPTLLTPFVLFLAQAPCWAFNVGEVTASQPSAVL